MSDGIFCPNCSTRIDTSERCPSERGMGRCVENVGHEGWHWSDIGRHPAISRWTGLYSTLSCPGRLDLNRWCQKPAGHDGWHNDGRGMSFGDPE